MLVPHERCRWAILPTRALKEARQRGQTRAGLERLSIVRVRVCPPFCNGTVEVKRSTLDSDVLLAGHSLLYGVGAAPSRRGRHQMGFERTGRPIYKNRGHKPQGWARS